MNKVMFVLVLIALCVFSRVYSDQKGYTDDGRRVLLKDDGTWEYVGGEKISHGKWTVSEDINPLDDSKKVIFRLIADKGRGVYGDPVVLIIRFMSNKTQAYISWNSYLGDEAYVTERFGSEKAARKKWGMSTDSQATFFHSGSSFAKKIMTVDRFVAQVTPYNENPITAIFDVRGLKEVTEPYIHILDWQKHIYMGTGRDNEYTIEMADESDKAKPAFLIPFSENLSGLVNEKIEVVVSFVIDPQGLVSSLRIDESSGNEDIDKAIVQTFRKWKFSTLLVGKKIRLGTLTYRINPSDPEG